MLPKRVAAREEYQKTDAGKASMQKSRRKWLRENEEKRAAHIILGNAVRSGRVKKPKSCSECGATKCRIHGHHEDYAHPLEVRWVCPKCHSDIHRGLR
jgi:transposase-like protein